MTDEERYVEQGHKNGNVVTKIAGPWLTTQITGFLLYIRQMTEH